MTCVLACTARQIHIIDDFVACCIQYTCKMSELSFSKMDLCKGLLDGTSFTNSPAGYDASPLNGYSLNRQSLSFSTALC